ncbi:RNA polymerase sigma factor [Chitinophaga sp. Cy-1792]|uniref:RNA polymerase sigma factor n=1 Tax=Chitinophaga sp. Cy-1792 TaxID=2608339 RepID=UPI001423AFA6|nr:sigma-70 family RNA polymerase sigma factor [Chitinophaga sp. Cy-1792]NIG56384.1 sigma-70 family RNA polymerase sigma factor [Chitinophaga sp. Cy-1792]
MPGSIVNILDEKDLWIRFKSGDKSAFTQIYRGHTALLLQYGIRFCDDQEKLKDLIHDLFIELWNTRNQLSDTDNIRFYLCKSLKYKLIRANYNYRNAAGKIHQYAQTLESAGNELTAEDRIIDAEITGSRADLLDKAIRRLSRRQQEIITLRFYMNFTNAEIADIMQMKYQSVSNLLYSALTRIKETLESSGFATRLLETFHLFL